MITTTRPADGKGRPSPILVGWDETTGEWDQASPAGRVIAAVRAGNYLNAAAAYARLNRNTVFNWLARGRESLPDGEDWERTDIDVKERPYVDFLGAIAFADGAFEVELVTLTLQAAREDKRFALQVLARKYGHWRESTKLTVTDEDTDSLTAAALQADPALVAKAAALAHEIEDARVKVAIESGEMPEMGTQDE